MRRLLLVLLLPAIAYAAPDRTSLIEAWEAAMRQDGILEAQGDGSYRYRSESIGYDGGVKIISAIVRSGEAWNSPGAERGATGTVDFDLGDLPDMRGATLPQGLAMWKAERQTFMYDAGRQSWQTAMEWARSRYRVDTDHRTALHVMQAYAIPVVLLALVALVFLGVARVQRQAKRQIEGASEINRLARENIERAAQLQEETRVRMRESLELMRRNAATLEAILEELRRRG